MSRCDCPACLPTFNSQGKIDEFIFNRPTRFEGTHYSIFRKMVDKTTPVYEEVTLTYESEIEKGIH